MCKLCARARVMRSTPHLIDSNNEHKNGPRPRVIFGRCVAHFAHSSPVVEPSRLFPQWKTRFGPCHPRRFGGRILRSRLSSTCHSIALFGPNGDSMVMSRLFWLSTIFFFRVFFLMKTAARLVPVVDPQNLITTRKCNYALSVDWHTRVSLALDILDFTVLNSPIF
jgi:hypothetical protein